MERAHLTRALTELYTAFADAPTVYAASCCERVSLARVPQTACRTCSATPTVTLIPSLDALVAWGKTVTLPASPG